MGLIGRAIDWVFMWIILILFILLMVVYGLLEALEALARGEKLEELNNDWT